MGLSAGRSVCPGSGDHGLRKNGSLSWSSSATSGNFTVQWAAALTGEWHSTWESLAGIAAGASNYNVDVPRYYRIADTNPPSNIHTVQGEFLGIGDGSTESYSGVLSHAPVVPGSFVLVIGDFEGVDNGTASVSGANGTTFAIDYGTGAWSLNTPGFPIADGVLLLGSYSFTASLEPVSGEIIGQGNGVYTSFTGFTLTDNCDGTLSGGFGSSGTANYPTGAWSIDLAGIPLADGAPITFDYSYFVP